MKTLITLLALASAPAFATPGQPLPDGIYNGPGISVSVQGPQVRVTEGCANGEFANPILSRRDSFVATGVMRSSLVIHPAPAPTPATFRGELHGDTLDLTIQRDGQEESERVEAVLGAPYNLVLCK